MITNINRPVFRVSKTLILVITLAIAGAFALNSPPSTKASMAYDQFPLIQAPASSDLHVESSEMQLDSGAYSKWSKVEISLIGPESTSAGNPNPFQIEANVVFTGPGGQSFVVPAFYDGDGAGGADGHIWKARFSPNASGTWSYASTSSEPLLDGSTGTFGVTDPQGCGQYSPTGLPDFACVGRLEYVGEHYLKFADGSFWVKAGLNEPESFLAPGLKFGFGSKEEMIDYLASKGINSIYMLLDNIGGDGKNVWPWLGTTVLEAQANHERFDVARLAEWERLFTYIQSKGLVLHLVFEDDSGWKDFNRSMYYREMIARFGHHNGLIWNISEEYNENYTSPEIKDFAQMISDLDAFGHPTTVHHVGAVETNWTPFLGDDRFDLTSFQFNQSSGQPSLNPKAIDWFEKAEDSGRIIPTSFDEVTRNLDVTQTFIFRHIAWSVMMGGGNFELFIPDDGSQTFTVQIEDVVRARKFIGDMAFWQMRPMNELLDAGQGYIFALAGERYSVYLPYGGQVSLNLSSTGESFEGQWFNPRDGTSQSLGIIQGGSVVSFTAPDANDWVLDLKKPGTPSAPEITSQPVTVGTVGQAYTYDVEATGNPAPTFSLVQAPAGMAIDPASGLISWTPASPGNYAVEVAATNSAGGDSQAFTLSISDAPVTGTLFSDDFNRADSGTVGNGWVEVETATAVAGIQGNRLCFLDTSDVALRPLVRHNFEPVSTGQLTWEFDFDWARTGSERTYSLLMQLGQSTGMNDSSMDGGVGVNLFWGNREGVNETLGYRVNVTTVALGLLSGQHAVKVEADLDAQTYQVSVDGVVVGAGLPFHSPVPLDTVRIFTDGLNEVAFSGRCFDNLVVSQLVSTPVAPEITSVPVTAGMVGQTYTYDVNASGYPAPSFSLAQMPAGMTIDPVSGLISWTPDSPGDYAVEVVATNSAGSDSQAFILSIENVPETAPAITSQPVTTGTVGQAYTYDVEASGSPAPSFSLTQMPAGMTIDPATGLISWMPDSPGDVAVEVVATNSVGSDNQNFTITVAEEPVTTILFSDDFNRADGGTIGNGWVEVETATAVAGIQGNRLCFLDSSDATMRPLVRHNFEPVSTGQLTWEFDFDWARTGVDAKYELLLQLGQASLMSNNNKDNGVGVNLFWGNPGGVNETLGYRKAGKTTALQVVSGPSLLTVQADLDAQTYQVSVDGVVVGAGIPFDKTVVLDTVRFISNKMLEESFSGRCFDNLVVSQGTIE